MKKFLLIIAVLYSSGILAQYPDWKFSAKSYYTNSFAEDGDYMWVGNFEGVVKINKNTGDKTFYNKANSGLPDHEITGIAIDHKHVKWISTFNRGLARFDGITWTVFDTSNAPFKTQTISNIAVDDSNNLWLTTYPSNGLFKYNGTSWTHLTTASSGIPNNDIREILIAGSTIWISTLSTLAKFDGNKWKEYTASNSTISNSPIVQLDKDNKGNIWLLHNEAVEKFDGNKFTLFDSSNTHLPHVYFSSMTIDTNNIIWTACRAYVGGPIGGIMSLYTGDIISVRDRTWIKYDTSNSPIFDTDVISVYADKTNRIWEGGFSGSLNIKNDTNWTRYPISTIDIYGRNITSIVFGKNEEAFIGTNGFPDPYQPGLGVVKYDGKKSDILSAFDGESWAITTDKWENLYTRSKAGLRKYDGLTWTTIPNMPPIELNNLQTPALKALATDTLGGVWMNYLDTAYIIFNFPVSTVHSEQGIAHYDGVHWKKYNHLNASPLGEADITQIKADHKNNIWISTKNKGLLMFDGTKWFSYNTSNSDIKIDFIECFTIDKSDNIWFSDLQFGLMKFDGTDFTRFTHPTLGTFFGGSAFSIDTDVDGTIWYTTAFDLRYFNGSDWAGFNASNSPIPSVTNTTVVSIDKFGNKWLGMNNGLLIYQGGIFTSVPVVANSPFLTHAFPNPFTSGFEIRLDQNMNNVELALYDQLGKQVFYKNHNQTQTLQIPRNGLKQGVYFYQIKSKNKIIGNGKVVAE